MFEAEKVGGYEFIETCCRGIKVCENPREYN
jgi:hypothetical protein